MIKKIAILLTTILLLNSIIAQAKVRIFACEPEWAALTEVIGAKHIDAFSATTALQNAHYIEARPSLISKARRADMIFCTGAELEIGWLPLLLRQSGNPDIQMNKPGHLLASDYVERLEIPDRLDRSMGDIHASGNPHVSLDPYRVLSSAAVFVTRLKQIDPEHAHDYDAHFLAFKKRWQKAIRIWEKQAAPLKGKKAVVYHNSWSYLFAWLGMQKIGSLEPKPGIPPTSAHLASLLKIVKIEKPAFILLTPFEDKKGARWLSEKSGIPILVLPYTVGGNQNAKDLFSLFDATISLLLSK